MCPIFGTGVNSHVPFGISVQPNDCLEPWQNSPHFLHSDLPHFWTFPRVVSPGCTTMWLLISDCNSLYFPFSCFVQKVTIGVDVNPWKVSLRKGHEMPWDSLKGCLNFCSFRPTPMGKKSVSTTDYKLFLRCNILKVIFLIELSALFQNEIKWPCACDCVFGSSNTHTGVHFDS